MSECLYTVIYYQRKLCMCVWCFKQRLTVVYLFPYLIIIFLFEILTLSKISFNGNSMQHQILTLITLYTVFILQEVKIHLPFFPSALLRQTHLYHLHPIRKPKKEILPPICFLCKVLINPAPCSHGSTRETSPLFPFSQQNTHTCYVISCNVTVFKTELSNNTNSLIKNTPHTLSDIKDTAAKVLL